MVRRECDPDPDTSYIGEFSHRAETEFAINHREHAESRHGDYPWFNPGSVETFDPKASWNTSGTREEWERAMRQNAAADYKRACDLNNGEFHYCGVSARAEVQLQTHGAIQTLCSGGLWGIETDSDDSYFAEVAAEELNDLRGTLKAAGFSARAISKAFQAV